MKYPLRQSRGMAFLVAFYLMFGVFIAPFVSGGSAHSSDASTSAASSASLTDPDEEEESTSAAKAFVRKEGVRLEVRSVAADTRLRHTTHAPPFGIAHTLPRFWGLDLAPRGPPAEAQSLRAPPRFS